MHGEPRIASQMISQQVAGHRVEVIDEEVAKLQNETPPDRETQRSKNTIEASFFKRLEQVGGFGGKADQLNAYFTRTGDPDYFNEDVARYKALSASDIQAVALAFLPKDRRVELTVMPEAAPAR